MQSFLPPSLNELLGVYHCKFNVFDKSCIITGANLSHEYFTTRQDRYLLINNCYQTSSFLDSFTSSLTQYCFQVTSSSVTSRSNLTVISPIKTDFNSFYSDTIISMYTSTTSSSKLSMKPLLQMFPFCRQEEHTLLQLLSSHVWRSVTIASPYPSFLQSLAATVRLGRERYLEIITASLQSHGFAGHPMY